MESIFISIAAGILVGWLDIFNYKTKKYLNHLSTAALLVMLWCLGAKIGCDEELLHNIIETGIVGMEVYSSYHSPEQIEFYSKQAEKYDLIKTLGSDFHGKTKSVKTGGHYGQE